MDELWSFSNLSSKRKLEIELVAYWELDFDPISDGYTPHETSAAELFRSWGGQVQQMYPNNLVPVWWYVMSRDAKVFELMPFQVEYSQYPGDFLRFFTWPVNDAGRKLDWLALPVIDKAWNKE